MSARIKLSAVSLQSSAGKAESRTLTSERSKKGFTLIELMVAISIVAILSTIGMVMFSSAQGSARDAKRKGDLEDIKQALYTLAAAKGKMTYLAGGTVDNTLFPSDFSAAASDAAAGMNPTAAGNSMGYKLVVGGYLKSQLHDPKCSSNTSCTGWNDYWLTVTGDGDFQIQARLETLPPPGTNIGCTLTGSYNYCISE